MLRNYGPFDRPAVWLAGLFLFESAVFYAHVQLRIAPYYPQVFDQLHYMELTHDILQDYNSRGLTALVQPFLSPSPNGVTYPIQGALSVLVLGTSRASLLTVNFIYFLAMQVAVFFTVMRSRSDASAAWLSISILMACDGIFRRAGGMADYRIDFSAMCLFGIWICLLIKTDQFHSRTFSILAALAAAALILMRFITAAFVGPIMAAFFILLFVQRRNDTGWRPRIINFSLSCATIASVTAPTLILAIGVINAYYVAGHIKGTEPAIRAAEVGVNNLSNHLSFYPRALLNYQIGSSSAALIGIVLAAMALGFVRRSQPRAGLTVDIMIGAFATALPMLELTADVSKSYVVAGIALVPFVLFIVLSWRTFVLPVLSRRTTQVVALLYVIAGLSAFIAHAAAPASEFSATELAEIERLNLVLASWDSKAPRMAFDRLTDYLNIYTVQFYFRQAHKSNLISEPQYIQTLGGIFSIDSTDVMRAIESSDIIVLSDHHFKRNSLPFDQSISKSWPQVDDYARNNLKLLATGTVDGITYRIFARDRG